MIALRISICHWLNNDKWFLKRSTVSWLDIDIVWPRKSNACRQVHRRLEYHSIVCLIVAVIFLCEHCYSCMWWSQLSAVSVHRIHIYTRIYTVNFDYKLTMKKLHWVIQSVEWNIIDGHLTAVILEECWNSEGRTSRIDSFLRWNTNSGGAHLDYDENVQL